MSPLEQPEDTVRPTDLESNSAQETSLGTTPIDKTALGPIVLLSITLIASWGVWAIAIRPAIPTQSDPWEVFTGVCARLIFWGVPCGFYLWKFWGRRYYEPLGVTFPLGWQQFLRTLLVGILVGALLLVGTATQAGLSTSEILSRMSEAKLDLIAPIFEELVFRGIIVSELINWTRDSSNGGSELRLKFWGGQVAAALIFLAVHWPAWLSHHGFSAACSMSLPIFTTGLILGFVFANTRSIWACVFLHWLNNQLSLLT